MHVKYFGRGFDAGYAEAMEAAARIVELHDVGECPQPCGCENKALKLRARAKELK